MDTAAVEREVLKMNLGTVRERELVRQAGVSLVAIVTEPGAPYTRTQTCTSLLLLKMNRKVSPKQILPK